MQLKCKVFIQVFISLTILICYQQEAFAIRNGDPIEFEDFPNYTYLYVEGDCGGLAVAHDVILTASHCIKNDDPFYIGGNYQQNFFSTDIIDYKFLSRDWNRELVMLKLSEPLKPSQDFILPRIANPSKEVKQITIIGVGADSSPNNSSFLKKGVVQFNGVIDEDNFPVAEYHQLHPKKQIACKGDSGGPSYINYRDKRFVHGIASRGDYPWYDLRSLSRDPETKCKATTKNKYIPLAEHIKWINTVLEEWNRVPLEVYNIPSCK